MAEYFSMTEYFGMAEHAGMTELAGILWNAKTAGTGAATGKAR